MKKEEKKITIQEMLTSEPDELIKACRDWMLNGETYQWSREKDFEGNLILKRW